MKRFGRVIAVAAWMFTMAFQAHGQDWTDMVWDKYGITFKAPTGFDIKKNTDKVFTCSGLNFTVTIKPYKDASLKANDAANKAYADLNATDMEIDVDEKVKLNGFEGYKILGSGKQNGKKLLFAALGAIDPDSDVNFSVNILFWDDPAHNDVNKEAALYILESFAKAH